MSIAYWDQWDKDDLDSWHGKDSYRDDDEDYEEEIPLEEEGCSCGYYCFDCLGISWRDFL